MRLAHYEEMISDPAILRRHRWPHTAALLQMAPDEGCKTALVTMSSRSRTGQVLEALELVDAFDVIPIRDDVKRGKAHREIYELVCYELEIAAERALVIEDSPAGVGAALAEALHCIAVRIPFTGEQSHALGLPEERWIVDDPAALPDRAR